MNYIDKIKLLIEKLNSYRNAYYNNSESIISDKKYDDLYDQLLVLENETGITLSNSPTQTVGYEVKSKLEKVKHSHPMLSLDKTKSVNELKEFIGNKECLLMHKLDGLTILLTYENGELVKAETRGNSEIGEDVTHNAKVFSNIPLTIQYTGKLEVEGEAIITYKDFNYINSKLPEGEKYKNPRNLVSGSVRQLDSKIAASRNIKFVAWKVPCGIWSDSLRERLTLLFNLGFEIAPYCHYVENDWDVNFLENDIQHLKDYATKKSYPIDGLVVAYDDITYGESLGNTGHHPKHSLAFKFYDEEIESELVDIKYGVSKNGILTPVAIFKPVEIEGTEVSRASLHNISIAKELKLGIGDTITVYKANQIIPQIRENLTRSNTFSIPDKCPVCGGKTTISKDNNSEVLICTNGNCKGRLLGRLNHFVSKNAFDIVGLSEATLSFLIEKGWVNCFYDLFTLSKYSDEWVKCEGFSDKSVTSILENISNSKKIKLENFIYALSIDGIGKTQSKILAKLFNGDWFEFEKALMDHYDFTTIDGFGEVLNLNLNLWFNNVFCFNSDDRMLTVVCNFPVEEKQSIGENILEGKTFVITGSVNHFKNREELKEKIESLGGKVSGSVSAKTNYLINNDTTSQTGKNKKAKELGVQIISEEEFISMINN